MLQGVKLRGVRKGTVCLDAGGCRVRPDEGLTGHVAQNSLLGSVGNVPPSHHQDNSDDDDNDYDDHHINHNNNNITTTSVHHHNTRD